MSIHQYTGIPLPPPPTTRVAFDWPFASTSPWNLPIANSATFVDDTNLHGGNSAINSTTFTTRIRQGSASDPLVTCTGGNLGTLTIRVPVGVSSSNGTDGDLDVVAPDGHTHWDFWRFIRQSDTSATYVVGRQNTLTDVRDGTGWGDAATATWGGTTAAGCAFMGGVIRAWELSAGTLNRFRHALAVSVAAVQLKQAATQAGTWQWPAITSDGFWNTYGGTIKIGTLIAIPRTVDITTLGLGADALALAWTLQNFGAYVVNTGGSSKGMILYAETESPEAIVNNLRAAWGGLRAYLRIVSNSTQSTPAGLTTTGAYPSDLYPAPTPVAVAK